MANLNSDVNTAKTDASKVVSTVETDLRDVESKTYSGKVLLVAIVVALVVGVFIGHLL